MSSGAHSGRGECGGFLKGSVILCPANRQPGGIHEWRVRRARADVVLSEMRQALSRPVWRDQGVSRGSLSALPRGEQGRCVCLPSADEADAAVNARGEGGHLGSLLIWAASLSMNRMQLDGRHATWGLAPAMLDIRKRLNRQADFFGQSGQRPANGFKLDDSFGPSFHGQTMASHR